MATRLTEQQVKAEMILVSMTARRISEDTEQLEELDRLINEQVTVEEIDRRLLTIPGIARGTATQHTAMAPSQPMMKSSARFHLARLPAIYPSDKRYR